MIAVTDPFMASVPATGIQRGRGGFLRSKDGAPYVSDPSGATVASGSRKGEIKRIKYGSPSGAGTLIENDVGLTKHKQRNTFLGIGMSEELREACRALVDMDHSSEAFTKAADTIVVEADKLTRSWLAADRGTHGHLICETVDKATTWGPIDALWAKGEEVGLDKPTQIAVANAWARLLDLNGLEILAVESSCCDDKWRLAGTLDRIVRLTKSLTFVKPGGELVVVPAGTVLILDLKFGKCRLAHPIQIASYAQSVPYDTDLETRGVWPWPIDQTHALIAHGDFGDELRPPSIELVWVDLVAGREHGGQCVVDAKAWAARDDVFSISQIVGEGEATQTPSCDIVPSSTLSSAGAPEPSAPSTVGEEAGAANTGHSPTPSPYPNAVCPHGKVQSWTGTALPGEPLPDIEHCDTCNPGYTRLTPDPDRLALVDARGALCKTPNEGADVDDGFDELWERLRTEFDQLPATAKQWRSQLAQRASQRGVSFLAQEAKTERRYSINRGLIALAIVDPDDQILRALLYIVLGEIAWFVGIEPGHLVGSLDYMQAAKFADLCDAYISPPPGDAA